MKVRLDPPKPAAGAAGGEGVVEAARALATRMQTQLAKRQHPQLARSLAGVKATRHTP